MKKYIPNRFQRLSAVGRVGHISDPANVERPVLFRAAMNDPRRRIDDRIRMVCASLTAASNGDAEPALRELLRLVHQKADRLKSRAARLLLNGDHLDGERRKSFR
jgi:hypothetical protein